MVAQSRALYYFLLWSCVFCELGYAQSVYSRIRYVNETYNLPVMRLVDLRKLFQVSGGYIRTDDNGWVFRDTDSIVSGEFIVPPTARPYRLVKPIEVAFFDRVRYREQQKDSRFVKTMRSYWENRESLMQEYFGKYVYWCNGQVQAVRDTQQDAEAFENPCGGETALVARVGSEIDTTYAYTSNSSPERPAPGGPMLRGPVATLDFEVQPKTKDRRQHYDSKRRRFDNMIIDTGSAEINLMHGDFNTQDFASITEVENRGLYGSGIARFVTLRVKLAEHAEYRPLQVLVNEDPIEHRLVGMRFLQHFFLLFGGPSGHWAAELTAPHACLHFLGEEGADAIIDRHKQGDTSPHQPPSEDPYIQGNMAGMPGSEHIEDIPTQTQIPDDLRDPTEDAEPPLP